MKALLIGLLVTGAIALTLACGGTADTGAPAKTTLPPQAEPCGPRRGNDQAFILVTAGL